MLETATAVLFPPVESDGPARLLESARLEFHASLQLLVDRACWVSGAQGGAIALEENGALTCKAVAGVCAWEAGEAVPVDAEAMRQCLAGKTVRVAGAGQGQSFAMALAVVQDEKVVGGLELVSDQEFSDEDEDRVSRIADLVTVILEHQDAAGRAERLEFREKELDPPSLWHVSEDASRLQPGQQTKKELENPNRSTPAMVQVHSCSACGFPVSPARTLCVDCEPKSETAPPSARAPLFATEAEESWWSAHGYTVASILVTALTVAIIFWMRHR